VELKEYETKKIRIKNCRWSNGRRNAHGKCNYTDLCVFCQRFVPNSGEAETTQTALFRMARAQQQPRPRGPAENRGDYYVPGPSESWLAFLVMECTLDLEPRSNDPKLNYSYVWMPERLMLCGIASASGPASRHWLANDSNLERFWFSLASLCFHHDDVQTQHARPFTAGGGCVLLRVALTGLYKSHGTQRLVALTAGCIVVFAGSGFAPPLPAGHAQREDCLSLSTVLLFALI
jgi:hypothetical protein